MKSDFQEYLHNHGKVINQVPSNGLGYKSQDIIKLASVLGQVCPQDNWTVVVCRIDIRYSLKKGAQPPSLWWTSKVLLL